MSGDSPRRSRSGSKEWTTSTISKRSGHAPRSRSLSRPRATASDPATESLLCENRSRSLSRSRPRRPSSSAIASPRSCSLSRPVAPPNSGFGGRNKQNTRGNPKTIGKRARSTSRSRATSSSILAPEPSCSPLISRSQANDPSSSGGSTRSISRQRGLSRSRSTSRPRSRSTSRQQSTSDASLSSLTAASSSRPKSRQRGEISQPRQTSTSRARSRSSSRQRAGTSEASVSSLPVASASTSLSQSRRERSTSRSRPQHSQRRRHSRSDGSTSTSLYSQQLPRSTNSSVASSPATLHQRRSTPSRQRNPRSRSNASVSSSPDIAHHSRSKATHGIDGKSVRGAVAESPTYDTHPSSASSHGGYPERISTSHSSSRRTKSSKNRTRSSSRSKIKTRSSPMVDTSIISGSDRGAASDKSKAEREELVNEILHETHNLIHNILNEDGRFAHGIRQGRETRAVHDVEGSENRQTQHPVLPGANKDEECLQNDRPELDGEPTILPTNDHVIDPTVVVPVATVVACEQHGDDPIIHFSDVDDDEGPLEIPDVDMFSSEMDENQQFARDAGLFYSQGIDVQQDMDASSRDIENPNGGVFSIFFRRRGRNDMIEVKDDWESDIDQETEVILDDSKLRNIAGHLSHKWSTGMLTPALARRVRDFQFAQDKRRCKYGHENPWGILGLYDHLSGIRIDVEWAEDAAWRRFHNEPYLSWAEFNGKKKSGFNKPFFTCILLLACTCMMITSIGTNGWAVEPIQVNPMIGPSGTTLVYLGAKESNLIVNHGEAWRLATPMFLHAGFIHFALNMLTLWVIGSAVERSHGFVATAILFIVPAIGGTILSALFLPQYISVGASGGIFGLIGACIADIAMNWTLLFSSALNRKNEKLRHIRVLAILFLDILVNCLLGLTPFVDNFIHLGGMAYGFLCGLSTMERLSMDFFGVKQSSNHPCSATKNACSRFFGLVVCVTAIMITTILLLGGDGKTTPCPSCRYLSCVPMPLWTEPHDKWWYCDDCEGVAGDAIFNPSTGLYEGVELTCPDGMAANVTLDGDPPISSIDILQENLPNYCRAFCASAHS